MPLPLAPILFRVAIAGIVYTGVGAAIFMAGQPGRQGSQRRAEPRKDDEKVDE